MKKIRNEIFFVSNVWGFSYFMFSEETQRRLKATSTDDDGDRGGDSDDDAKDELHPRAGNAALPKQLRKHDLTTNDGRHDNEPECRCRCPN